jgi:hypothetical protein
MTGFRAAAAATLAAALVLAGAGPASAKVKFTSIHYNVGSTVLTNSNINKEYVTIKNTGRHKVRIAGWKVVDRRQTTTGANAAYVFKHHFILRPGRKVNLHSGKGRDTRKNVYWGLSRFRWNDGPSGDTAYLNNRRGKLVSTCSYTPATQPSPAPC